MMLIMHKSLFMFYMTYFQRDLSSVWANTFLSDKHSIEKQRKSKSTERVSSSSPLRKCILQSQRRNAVREEAALPSNVYTVL